MNMIANETHRLPDGTYTSSVSRYTQEWRRIARPLCDALDAELIGFDPHLSLRAKDGGGVFSVPSWAAITGAN